MHTIVQWMLDGLFIAIGYIWGYTTNGSHEHGNSNSDHFDHEV